MLRYALEVAVVNLHALAASGFRTDGHTAHCSFFQLIFAFYHEEVGSMTKVHSVLCRSEAAAERKEINGIEHIALAHAVSPYKAVYAGREVEIRGGKVAVVEYGKVVENHYLEKYLSKFLVVI